VTWNLTTGTLPDRALVGVAIDSSGGLLAAVAGNGLYRSTDRGEHWTKLSYNQDYAYPLIVAPDGAIVAGAFTTYYRSTDNGMTWRQGANFDLNVESILATAGGDLYIGTFGTQTLPGSLSKVSASGSVTKILTAQATVTALLQQAGSGIFAGVEGGGVYRSQNGTTGWGGANNGLVDKAVYALATSADGHTLYAGTSTGVYRSTVAASSVDAAGELDRFRLGDFSPNPSTASTMIPLLLPRHAIVTAEVYSELGRKVATIQSGELSAGEHLLIWNVEGVPEGVYWCRIQREGLSESRRIVVAR
jgi:hypothetical protein